MAVYGLLSLICLLASTVDAQGRYSYADLADGTITKSVTETVTKYLSQCGITPTPFDVPDVTLSGTITVTSTLQSTVSVIILSNATEVSGVAPVGLETSQSDSVYSSSSSPSISHHTQHNTSLVASSSACYGLNCSSPFANATKPPCSTTATVIVTVPHGATSSHTLSYSHSQSTPHSTSSAEPTCASPSPVPVSESAIIEVSAAMQGFLGALSIAFILMAGFL
ncbi:hypothetical protein AAE478_008118 [Parahypoxylon ruwenzoriense]